MHQIKLIEKNIKKKRFSQHLFKQRTTRANYTKTYVSVKLFTLAFIKNVQEELNETQGDVSLEAYLCFHRQVVVLKSLGSFQSLHSLCNFTLSSFWL